jgi:hypothetical protein
MPVPNHGRSITMSSTPTRDAIEDAPAQHRAPGRLDAADDDGTALLSTAQSSSDTSSTPAVCRPVSVARAASRCSRVRRTHERPVVLRLAVGEKSSRAASMRSSASGMSNAGQWRTTAYLNISLTRSKRFRSSCCLQRPRAEFLPAAPSPAADDATLPLVSRRLHLLVANRRPLALPPTSVPLP